MAVKTTTTAKEPAQKATQTTLKVDAAKDSVEKKPVVKSETAAEVKKEPEAKKPADKKPAAKKTTARKTTAKKTTTRKSAAKKTTTRKTAAKKAADTKTEVFIQYRGEESSISSVMEKVNAAWEAEGKKISAIKRVKLYVKPEDNKAYYVINEGLKNASIGAVEL